MENIIEYRGYQIQIVQDEDSGRPSGWDDEVFLVYSHMALEITAKGLDARIINQYDKYFYFAVDAYVHSDIKLYFVCALNEDAEYVDGYIVVDRNAFNNDIELAEKAARSMLDDWNDYLSGNIYGFIISKPVVSFTIDMDKKDEIITINDLDLFLITATSETSWKSIDSCWGFYGDPETSGCLSEAKSAIDNLLSK